jgi:uncharacterized membrane protein YccC
MSRFLPGLREALASGPNRIALSTALRGTIATATPLALLPQLGLASLAYPAVLGALATSMVDVGGPYRTRLVTMLVQGLGGAGLLLVGSVVLPQWWLATIVMAAIALVSGLVRVVGPGGASLGINTAVAFLVGLQVGTIGEAAGVWALGYGVGGLWTVLVTLAFWQLRPYRRLEQEVAGAWEAAASLVAAAAAPVDDRVVARRRREQRIAAGHAAARAALERARDALGEMRAGTVGPGTTIAQLVVLRNAAARIAAAAVTLGEAAAPAAMVQPAAAALERACRAVVGILLEGKGDLSLAEMRQELAALRSDSDAPERDSRILALAQAMRHLDNAEEALRLLRGARWRLPELWRLPVTHRLPRGAVLDAIRAQMTLRSAIFRHALRVAAVTSLDTGVIVALALPHGIWLPMTSLVILQPDYGGTVSRAVARGFGTAAGAVVAGMLLTAVHGTTGYDAAIGLLLFATFLLIRRRYGYAVTFLTPLVILLIGLSGADPWIDLAERVAYTVAGALLALAAGYLLWPQWEREQLRDRLARAIRADQSYLDAVLSAAAGGPTEEIPELRRQAEIAVANADAGFQRLRAEPAARTAPVAAPFALLVYLHRLCRHAIALAAQTDGAAVRAEPLGRLRQLLGAALEDAAQAVAAGRPPAARPAVDAPLAEVVSGLARMGRSRTGDTVAALLGRLVSDTTSVIGAAAAASAAKR